MTNKRWIFILIYLMVFCSFALILTAMAMLIIIELFFFVFYNIPFDLSKEILWRCFEGGIAGGIVVGGGNWIWYYRHYRS
ncbi:hypothetical protein [Photorhabdus australis]|uniref:hypothetical protein n=1 Tax=Photorhabdus australis TaxID=286156 RepID=UPI0005621650|nr:hypothetical protein [Photorhabdus australis]